MSQYRKKPVVIEATRWFKNGDHPNDSDEGDPVEREGRVVRYYRPPDDDSSRVCEQCGHIMHAHGWIDTPKGGHVVCPGDWIITGVYGDRDLCKPVIFFSTYEEVEA